jgi:hypothetical protein
LKVVTGSRVRAPWPRVVILGLLLPAMIAGAAPIEVRLPEGNAHGFVDFYAGSKKIGHGELVQFLRGGELENRLTVAFDDGSLYDETVTFTQARVFRLRSYKLRQEGPSFPEASEVSFDDEGRYRARLRKADGEEEVAEGHTDVPADVYNGLTSTLLKNLAPGATAEVHQLAFTPKPRLLNARLVPDGDEKFALGKGERIARRYRIALSVSGIAGVAARVIGKDPPDVHYWIAQGPAPTFVRFEGPLTAEGPVWRAELGAPRWRR